jgi:molecular chaperone DnaJ
MPRDFYEILGLSRGASADDIKKAYRKLSKELHPDKHKGDKTAENTFKEVNEAYETLGNPQKKQMYDQFGTTGNGQGGFRPGAGGGFGGFDFGGGQAFDFGDLFEGFFGGGARGPRGPQRGADIEVAIEIGFAEAVSGLSRPFEFDALRTCSECKGDGAAPGAKVMTCSECGGTGQVTRTTSSFFGQVQQRTQCPKCRGSGKVPEKACPRCDGTGRRRERAKVTVDIPAGIADGQTLRVRGEGNAGERGASAGDLYVHVRVTPDPRFAREGDDIHSTLTVSVPDAILGTEMTIQTVHGPVTLKVPAGTQSGQMLRIKGKGMPVLQTSRHGDHFVTVTVEIPTRLSREEKRLVEEWKKLN